MKVIDFQTIGATELLTLDTGHVATLTKVNGDEHLSILTRTGKPVAPNTWKRIERAIFETNPTRSKW